MARRPAVGEAKAVRSGHSPAVCPICRWFVRQTGFIGLRVAGRLWPTGGMRTSELALNCLMAAVGGVGLPADAAEPAPVVVAALPALPDAHGFAGCFAGVAGGRLLVAGGANFPDGVMPWDGGRKVWHDGVFALDLAAPEAGWKQVGKLPEVAGYGVSIQVPQGVLLVGGGNLSHHFTATRLLRWQDGGIAVAELPGLPIPLANACGAAVGGRVHLVGGTTGPDATTASSRHFVMDPGDPAAGWTELAPLPGDGVMLAAAAAADGGLLVAGGCALHAGPDGKPARTYLKSCWKFTTAGWRAVADLPRAAVGAASPAWIANGKPVLAGGDDGSQAGGDPRQHRGFCRDLLAYDAGTDHWTRWAELKTGLPVTLPGVAIGGGYILVSGEIRPGVRTPQVIQLKAATP